MSRPPFDADSIRALASILVETGLTEIEVAEKDTRIRVVRALAPVHAAVASPPVAAAIVPGEAADLAEAEQGAHPGAVLSPMVGVAYLAPEPSAPPYVTVGQSVEAGQTVLLIEAMKTFNQIKAPRAGTVVRIMVGAGTPVEYGEPLMIIE